MRPEVWLRVGFSIATFFGTSIVVAVSVLHGKFADLRSEMKEGFRRMDR
ncbi:MAG: hypothetical protein ABSH09_36845 [Bryobacteraceae bacterium]|jgi:hypothetical protein